MNYKKLAEEYISESKKLKAHIKSIKNKSKKEDGEKVEENYRIKLLYSMYLDLKHIGEYLFDKYGGNNRD